MATAAWPLQVAIVGKLDGDEKLAALVSGVYDEPPEKAQHPYITVGNITEVPDDAHDRQGLNATVTLHIWSRYRGFKEALEVLGHLDRVLDRQPIVVPGWTNVSIAREWHDTMRDPDPEIRHIPVRYRVWLEQE